MEALTGVPINHVVVVDFSRFKELIDTLGGVTIDVPKPILANKFDCPFATQAECDRWPGWRFRTGEQTMDGRRALIYARVRVNQLDPSENDITRGERQQAVVQAMADEITSFSTFLRMPFIGDELAAPLATDLSANQFVQLGWVKRRTPSSGLLRCRLGGSIAAHRRAVVHHRQRGQRLRRRHGRGQGRTAAAAAGDGHLRARLPGRPERLTRGGRCAASRYWSAAFDSEGFDSGLSGFLPPESPPSPSFAAARRPLRP